MTNVLNDAKAEEAARFFVWSWGEGRGEGFARFLMLCLLGRKGSWLCAGAILVVGLCVI